MKKFTVVYDTPDRLPSQVDILLDDGWELHGPTFSHNTWLCQAMTLTKKPKKTK